MWNDNDDEVELTTERRVSEKSFGFEVSRVRRRHPPFCDDGDAERTTYIFVVWSHSQAKKLVSWKGLC